MNNRDETLQWRQQVQAFATRLQSYGINVTYTPDAAHAEVCEVCGGLGVVKADLSHIPLNERHQHPAFGKMYPCPNARCAAGAEARTRREEARIKSAGLPPEYGGLTFDSWERLHRDALKGKWLAAHTAKLLADVGAVSLYDLNQSLGGQHLHHVTQKLRLPVSVDVYERREQVVLYGLPNMGKTGLAAAVVNARRQMGKPTLYIRCYDIFVEINRRKDAEEYPRSEDVLDSFKRCPFLIVDEAGIKGETESRLDRFEAIVRHRAAHHLPTLLTTNYSPREFEDAWGTQTWAILNRQGWWVPVDGAPLRTEMEG